MTGMMSDPKFDFPIWIDKTTRLMCDKAILSECIQKWFGSIEDFDDLVRRDVRKAFAEQVMRVPFGYLWFSEAKL